MAFKDIFYALSFLPFVQLPYIKWFSLMPSEFQLGQDLQKENCNAVLKVDNFQTMRFYRWRHCHSSLLSVFGLSATSTYDSYLPLIFGIFGMIWGHFWNVRKGRFRGHGGRRGQTASKSKTTKILNENLLKLDEIQILASATSKMTSWPQRPRKGLSIFFQRLHF